MEYCPYCMHPVTGGYCQSCGKPTNWTPGEQQLPAGTMLDGSGLHRYLTGAAIGQGGFGITYIAVEPDSGKRVAVKECFPVQCATRGTNGICVEPKPGMAAQLQGALNSFLDEARLLAKQTALKSVVQVEDFFSTNGTAYLVMEYLDGVTLSDKMQAEGRLPAQQLLSMLRPLMGDIGMLHASGIIHRDISPDNIMWMPDGSLKLLDFGCARSMEDGKSMSILLKHGFAPVEQYQTRGQGPWTDIYSLCATIYYCITGYLPTSAVERLEGDALKPPTELGADLTPKQEAALLWGMAVQPTKRPQHIELLTGQLCPEKPNERKKREPAKKRKSSVSGNKKKFIGIAAAALVLIIALVAVLGGGEDGPNSGPNNYIDGSDPVVTMPKPSPTVAPVSGVKDQIEYISYGEYAVVTGCQGAVEDVLTVPEDIDGIPVTAIADEAFLGQSVMSTVIIPESVESIGSRAFAGCSSLRMVFARRNMEIGEAAFDGCDKLRALFKTNDFYADLDEWGLSENVAAFATGMDTGVGSLKLIFVTDDGVVYGVTDEDAAVVLDIPAGLSTVTLVDSVGEYPVLWMHESALDRVDSDIEVYLADGMGFPYSIRDSANWSFKDDCAPDSFCFNWYLSCYIAQETNSRRPSDAPQVEPVRGYVEAATKRAEEIHTAYQSNRPDGSKFSTVFEEFGVDFKYCVQWIDHFSVDKLEDELLDCAEALVDKSESYDIYYVSMGAATYYDNDEVYLCRLAGYSDDEG